MFKFNVLIPEESDVCVLSLPVGLLSVTDRGHTHSWAGTTRIRAVGEDALEVEGFLPDDGDLAPFLTDLQNGLLYAALSGLRLVRPIPLLTLDCLRGVAARTDLAGPGGRIATLAFWSGGLNVRRASQIAATEHYLSFTLSRSEVRTVSRLSVLTPQAWGSEVLANLVTLQGLRLRPQLTMTGPPPTKPERAPRDRSIRTYPAAPGGPVNFGEGGTVTGWSVPLLTGGEERDSLSPLLEEIDRAARDLCERGVAGRNRVPAPFCGLIEGRLIRFWQVGRHASNRARRMARAEAPKPVILHLRERARVIEELTREGRKGGDFSVTRALIRSSCLKAWRHGSLTAQGKNPAIQARFCEECCAAMRPVPAFARGDLISLHQEEPRRRYPAAALRALVETGLLQSAGSRILTDAGRVAVQEELTRRSGRRPSLMSIAIRDTI